MSIVLECPHLFSCRHVKYYTMGEYQRLMNSLIIVEHLNYYNFVSTHVPRDDIPPLPQLTTPILRLAGEHSKTNHPIWLSHIHRQYGRFGIDLEPLFVIFFSKYRLTTSVRILCTKQRRLTNRQVSFIVYYYDEKREGNCFGNVKIYALMNGTDAWACIEQLAPTPPTTDFRWRPYSYPKRNGRPLWAPILHTRAAAGTITCNDQRYCVTDSDICSR